MIALLQRVSQAKLEVDQIVRAQIGRGLLVLLCAERGDTEEQADALLKKLLGYRVFSDENGKMNLSMAQTGGGLLLAPQFTLAADTNSGTRPSFTPAAAPEDGRRLFEYAVQQARRLHADVQTGIFGADMQISLTNDGPVTFWLQVKPKQSS
ncbi:D-aminoacyl-tRNA deacylase [Massilia sp. W12]|uniref:D-aminoacyl-tRNA deacylase n=1 Tax=Massilia sp. W12 TaxID=3126507 RepID=UPI0030CB7928